MYWVAQLQLLTKQCHPLFNSWLRWSDLAQHHTEKQSTRLKTFLPHFVFLKDVHGPLFPPIPFPNFTLLSFTLSQSFRLIAACFVHKREVLHVNRFSLHVAVWETETVYECEHQEDLFGIFRFTDDSCKCSLRCHGDDQHYNSPPARVSVWKERVSERQNSRDKALTASQIRYDEWKRLVREENCGDMEDVLYVPSFLSLIYDFLHTQYCILYEVLPQNRTPYSPLLPQFNFKRVHYECQRIPHLKRTVDNMFHSRMLSLHSPPSVSLPLNVNTPLLLPHNLPLSLPTLACLSFS